MSSSDALVMAGIWCSHATPEARAVAETIERVRTRQRLAVEAALERAEVKAAQDRASRQRRLDAAARERFEKLRPSETAA